MDSYLTLAKRVLREARQPLSAREILSLAYQLQIVPASLYGRTQHKTLQARLSEDILHERERSEFFRTAPGRFFLRALQSDETLPLRSRREYTAPPRARQLGRFDVVTFRRSDLDLLLALSGPPFFVSDFASLPITHKPLTQVKKRRDVLPLRILVVLLRGCDVALRHKAALCEGALPCHTTIGIEGVVRREDRSLFSLDQLGLLDAAHRTVAEWLNIPKTNLDGLRAVNANGKAPVFYDVGAIPSDDDLMAYLSFDCSEAMQVLKRVQDRPVDWQPIPLRPNDIKRFDRWSAKFLGDPKLQISLVEMQPR